MSDSLQTAGLLNEDGTGYYSDKTNSESILHNLQDMTWFMWNYGNAFTIPLMFLITYHTMRLTYILLKDFAGTDIVGWLYVYSFN